MAFDPKVIILDLVTLWPLVCFQNTNPVCSRLGELIGHNGLGSVVEGAIHHDDLSTIMTKVMLTEYRGAYVANLHIIIH